MSLKNNNYTWNALNSFNQLYEIDYDNLGKLYNYISSKTFASFIINLFTKSKEAITSIRVYPFKIPTSELHTLSYMRIAGDETALDNEPKARKFKYYQSTSIKVIDGYRIPNQQSFLDIEPFTTAQLYLPYIGYIDLNWSEIIGTTMSVEYAIDYNSGYATAYVTIQDGIRWRTIASKSGKIGFEIAWGSTNMAENIRNIASTIISTALSIYTIGASNVSDTLKTAGKVATFTKAGVSIANSIQIRYERGGSVESLVKTSDPTTPHIILKKQKYIEPSNEYNAIYGKPLYESRTLAQMRGLTIVDDIHLTNFPNATEPELREIENLLKTGVHL